MLSSAERWTQSSPSHKAGHLRCDVSSCDGDAWRRVTATLRRHTAERRAARNLSTVGGGIRLKGSHPMRISCTGGLQKGAA